MTNTINPSLTEEDVKNIYITPALDTKWDKRSFEYRMEVKITDGRINIAGNVSTRQKPKFADYLLYFNGDNPIAVVEAKDMNHSASYGLQQAMTYAQMLDIPFAYSTNGTEFYEHDFLTGAVRNFPMDQFPTKDELVKRYYGEVNGGKGFSENELKAINQPCYTSATTNTPRYYQRIAINRTLSAIAKGQNRILLTMATGTGKTFTAFQIVYRLLKSGLKKKILYLADRNVLVDQSILQDFSPLDNVIHKINVKSEDPTTITAHQVYFALYQQLVGEGGEEHYAKLFKPDFFDLVIVDECHRGSAKDDSSWKQILEYFTSATQIGMTATPKETKYVSNINYFGEPIYTYSLKQGIEDGFLAPFKVYNIITNISDGWRPLKGQIDINGNEIEDRIYNNKDYDYNIVIQSRIDQVAEEITNYLKTTDRMQKTIVFCADEDAAERMRIALINKNKDMVKDNPDYIVRITGSDDYGKSKLEYFISVSQQYPVIATTSKLLSTGVDCKMVKLIVLDQMINSMTEFKQIVGRGTRVREKEGKMSFAIMDFRNVTRLFADPDWDGPIEIDPDYKPGGKGGDGPVDPKPPVEPTDPKVKPIVDGNECSVQIINKIVQIYDTNGKLLRTEKITTYAKNNILSSYDTIENFISNWTKEEKKEKISKLLLEKGISLEEMKKEDHMEDVDDFDFILHVAYGQKALTRKERAEGVKKTDFFTKYSGAAKEVLEDLLLQYEDNGVYDIEDINVLKTNRFANKYGTPAKIAGLFGGRDGFFGALKNLQDAIYGVRV
ncbi:MAG: DEAD/DEAH box helicase family protein [Bacillota bacterium]|nr:DEAD/DEAH box helicase family protein [Bacillota bacterium]